MITGEENLYRYPKAVWDVDESAEVELRDEFHVGYHHFEGSEAETYVKIQQGGKLCVRGRFRMFYNSTIQIFQNGHLTLGNSYLNTDSIIACAGEIEIGDGVAIARGVKIYDSDHHQIIEQGCQTNKKQSILIEDHVWIGVNVVILKGVKIGTGAVIAAGAVVTEDVPEHCMVAGVPARVIKTNVEWK